MRSVEKYPDGDPNDPAYWTASNNVHGSPFAHDITSGIREEDLSSVASHFQVYPNPTRDLLMIQTNAEPGYTNTLRIFDLRGTLYYHQDFEDYMEVSLRGLNLRPGIYFADIVSPAGKETRKVIYAPR